MTFLRIRVDGPWLGEYALLDPKESMNIMQPHRARPSPSRYGRSFLLIVGALVVSFTLHAAAPYPLQEESAGPEPSATQQPSTQLSAYRILAEGPVNQRLARRVRRDLEKAAEAGAKVVIIEIDTFGGELGPAVALRDTILDAPLRTIAFINKRAISAGALLALSTHEIVMAPGATIGAAEPLRITWKGPEPAGEKMISYFRNEMKATAESRGHPVELAEAMVDPDVVVPGLVEKGKLLTLTTQEALKFNLAAAESDGLAQLLQAYQLELVPESQEGARRGERAGLFQWFEQIRAWHVWIVVGLGLILAEMVIAGFFLLWFGVGAFLASLLAFLGLSQNIQIVVFLASSFVLLVFSRTIFKSVLLRAPEKVATNMEALRGRKGITVKAIEGALKPGEVKVGGEMWAAVCDEGTRIAEGATVEVLEVVGNKVRVKSI